MSNRFAIVIALLGAMPGVYLRLTHTEIGTIPDTVLFGLSIVSESIGEAESTFGTLGTVAALLVWLYLAAFSVLFGAEIDAFRRHWPAA